MRWRPTYRKFSVVAGLAALWLHSSHILANVTGNDAQLFNATSNGLDFVTVHSSETLMPGILNLGFFMNYAVNTLPFLEEADEKTRQAKIRDSLLAADFNVGYGVFNNLDLGISFPFIVKQIVNSSADRGEFENVGNTEIRGNVKYRFWGTNEYGGAVIVSTNFNRLVDSPYVGDGGGLTVNYEVAFDTTISNIALGLNLGYRDRNPGEQIPAFINKIAPMEDQFIYSAAASYYISPINSKLIFEVYGAQPATKKEDVTVNDIARVEASREALLGIKHDLSQSIALHFGAGTELDHAVSTPDYRVYVGVNATFGHVGQPKKPKLVKQKAPAPAVVPKVPDMTPPDAPEVIPEGGPGDEVFVLRDVNFLFDSSDKVLQGAKDEMKKLADRIKANGYSKIIIEGHTDSIGDDDYNMKLGQRRASSIRDYLIVNHQMDANKIQAVSYGEHKPIASNGNYQGRQLNRRVVFRIFY